MDRCDPYTDKFIKDGTDKNVGTNDTISRQAAIKDAETWAAVDEYEKHLQKKVVEWLKEFPPAKLSTNLAEVGTDCISRQAAIEAVNSLTYPSSLMDVKRKLIELPPAEPKRGTTTLRIGRTRNSVTMWYECAECGEPVDQEDAFCRRCGRGIIHE